MLSRSGAMRVWLLAAALLLLLVGALACEAWPGVKWENATSQRVAIHRGGEYAFSLEPHESQEVSTSEDDWRPEIRVVAEDGRVLLEDKITWDELGQMDYRIVITEPVHPVSPTSPVVPYTETPAWRPTPLPAACWGRGPVSPSAPSPPTNLRAELVSNPMARDGPLVGLQWDDNVDDERCYVVERKLDEGDWSVYESIWGPNEGSVSLVDVPAEVGLHCYRVSYGNYEGLSAYSNEACVDVEVVPVVVTPTPHPVTPIPVSIDATPRPWPCNLGDDPPYSELAPNPPTDVVAVVRPQLDPRGGYRVDLLWRLDGPDPLCYMVQRLEHDGAWRTFEEPGFGGWERSAFDVDPERGVRCYRVAVANEHGRSDWSNEACANGPTIVLPVTPEPTPTPTPP